MDQYIGKMLDNRYEILERIGAGGMAVVYKAKCHRLNRLVAVKILKADLAQDADFRRRFNTESQAVAQLSHPNIMSVYDVSRGGDVEYIVMELLDGITLKQYMAKRGQMHWQEALHFITQIARGLSHAHSRGIVHRDIKPQNIMVLRDGSVKVADFGIACLENSAQTLTQEALGSVHYISPEQAKGDRADARSDIYSAGVVLYEMLTGRLPFEGDSAVSVAIQHLSSIPLAPREVNPDIPPQMELICMKAMAPDLEKRYFSAEDMIYDLEAFRKNPDITLDFDIEDLRSPVEPDEPTRPLHPVKGGQLPRKNSPAREYEEHDEHDDDYYPTRKMNKKQTALLIVAAVLALALVGVMFRSIMESFENKPEDQYVVPNLIGMTVDQASQHPDVVGTFTITEAGSEFNTQYKAGQILRQEPKADEFRKGENRNIQVWVSAGEDIGVMLEVRDMTVPQAKVELQKLIRQYDLEIEIDEEGVFDDEIAIGKIAQTIPSIGYGLKKGDTIRLFLSKGPRRVVVPPLVGQKLEDVLPQLEEEYKLVCDPAKVEKISSAEPAGTILWQSIAATTEVDEGEEITFRVSSGKQPTPKAVTFDLPRDGRIRVLVEIFVGAETIPQFSSEVLCSDEYVWVPLLGSGTQYVRVMFDGLEDINASRYVDFESTTTGGSGTTETTGGTGDIVDADIPDTSGEADDENADSE